MNACQYANVPTMVTKTAEIMMPIWVADARHVNSLQAVSSPAILRQNHTRVMPYRVISIPTKAEVAMWTEVR